jgi:hypothetical protein
MSSFFGGINGIRFPDARINGGGPLPTSLSGPAGVNGDPDGKYNFTSSLLGDLNPYQYEPNTGRMGSDRNYQQIPHRKQFFVPCLSIPTADNTGLVALSHAVDQGDIAWIVNMRQKSVLLASQHSRTGTGNEYANVDILVNLATINYILAGLTYYKKGGIKEAPDKSPWKVLNDNFRHDDPYSHCPFGICAGSEKQGGLHETGLAPIQAACSHVTTLTVDGQNRDLVNYWQDITINAGDVLIMRKQKMRVKSFVLNHYYKGTVAQNFPSEFEAEQWVPDVMRNVLRPKHNSRKIADDYLNYARKRGFWRIAQTFNARLKCSENPPTQDDTTLLKGQLLQVTFAPVWTVLFNEYSISSGPGAGVGARAGAIVGAGAGAGVGAVAPPPPQPAALRNLGPNQIMANPTSSNTLDSLLQGNSTTGVTVQEGSDQNSNLEIVQNETERDSGHTQQPIDSLNGKEDSIITQQSIDSLNGKEDSIITQQSIDSLNGKEDSIIRPPGDNEKRPRTGGPKHKTTKRKVDNTVEMLDFADDSLDDLIRKQENIQSQEK